MISEIALGHVAIPPEKNARTSRKSSLTWICEALLKGYKEHSQNALTDIDKEYLYDCVRLITYELALRFFADYLAGDVYFKIRHDGQNLHRARVQTQLCRSIEARESQIRRILKKIKL